MAHFSVFSETSSVVDGEIRAVRPTKKERKEGKKRKTEKMKKEREKQRGTLIEFETNKTLHLHSFLNRNSALIGLHHGRHCVGFG